MGYIAVLSDACSDFLSAFSSAASTLALAVHHYSDPEFPLKYGSEIDALRRACAKFQETPCDPEVGADLLRLAKAVMIFHDTPPLNDTWETRRRDMLRLIQVMQEDLNEKDRASVPRIVAEAIIVTNDERMAAEQMRGLLEKLTKGAYDIAIKIISDIGSATIKKMLGL